MTSYCTVGCHFASDEAKPCKSWYEKCRYLLLEDRDTGDILIPLSQLKDVLTTKKDSQKPNNNNNSRLIANLPNRAVEMPPGADFGEMNSGQALYWMLAFESPKNVKGVVKKEIGNDNSTKASNR